MLHPASLPLVNYREHPAFQGMATAASSAVTDEIAHHIADANAAMRERYDAIERLPSKEAARAFAAGPNRSLDAIRTICERVLKGTEIEAITLGAIEAVRKDVLDEYNFKNSVAGNAAKTTRSNAKAVLADLNEDRISVGRLDDAQIKQIELALTPHMDLISSSDNALRGVRAWRNLPRAGRYWNILTSAFHEKGYLEAASAFHGCEMEILSVNLVFSHDKERWWKECYADCGVELSPLTYLHHDQDWHQIKSVIYFGGSVNADNGAFSYIKGALGFRRGNILPHFYFHLVNALNRLADAHGRGSQTYYRRAFSDPETRRWFASLPPALQGTTHFGDDLLESDTQTADLLARERVVDSSAGNLVLFNGGDLLHRGGLVQRGQRWSLQLMLGPMRDPVEKLRDRGRQAAIQVASRLAGWERLERFRTRRRRPSA